MYCLTHYDTIIPEIRKRWGRVRTLCTQVLRGHIRFTMNGTASLKRTTGLLLTLCLMAPLSGCGFILHGGKQEITFDSKPPGVTVKLDNAMQFVTPYTIAITRSTNHHAAFAKEGYESQQVVIKHDFLVGHSIVGNILPLFPVGLAIDVITGSAWGFEQDYIAVDMTKPKARP